MTQKPGMIAVAPIAALLLVGLAVYVGKRSSAPAGPDDPQIQNMATPAPPAPGEQRGAQAQNAAAPPAGDAVQQAPPPPAAPPPDPEAEAKAASTAALIGIWVCEGTVNSIGYSDTASYVGDGSWSARMIIHTARPSTLLRWGRWKFETGSDLSRTVTRSAPPGAAEVTIIKFQLRGRGQALIADEDCRKVS